MFLLKFCQCAKQTFKLNCAVMIKFSVLLKSVGGFVYFVGKPLPERCSVGSSDTHK